MRYQALLEVVDARRWTDASRGASEGCPAFFPLGLGECKHFQQSPRIPLHERRALKQGTSARPALRHTDNLATSYGHLSGTHSGETDFRRPRRCDRPAPVHVGPVHSERS
jgi:hypothetical protein